MTDERPGGVDIVDALDAYDPDVPDAPDPSGLWRTGRRRRRQRRVLTGATLSVLVAGIAAAVLSFDRGDPVVAGPPDGAGATTSVPSSTASTAPTTTPTDPAPAEPSTPTAPPATPPSTTATTADPFLIVALPSHDADLLPSQAIEAVLRGDRDHDGGCAWLETLEGPRSVRWPRGYVARFPVGGDPRTFELLDGNGDVVATGGQRVIVAGGDSADPALLERCQVDGRTPLLVGRPQPA